MVLANPTNVAKGCANAYRLHLRILYITYYVPQWIIHHKQKQRIHSATYKDFPTKRKETKAM
jgi:hypothetical protein